MLLIRNIRDGNWDAVLAIVNEATRAYRGVIPAVRCKRDAAAIDAAGFRVSLFAE